MKMKKAKIGEKYRFTTKPGDLKFANFHQLAFIPMGLIPIDRLFCSDYVLKSPDAVTSGTYFEEGDLLVSKITPCFENGKQGIARNIPNGFGIATTEVIPIKPIPNESDLAYLAYCLLDRETRHELAEKMEGATGRQRLSKNVLQDWEIPFPSFSEQQAIAAVLLKIQSAVEIQDKTISTLKELKAATMTKLFQEGLGSKRIKATPIGNVPEDWSIAPLGEFLTLAQYGLSIRGERHGQYPILRMNCQEDGLVVFRDLQYIDLDPKTAKNYLLDQGDLLFNRTNSFELVGRIAIYQSSEKAVFASYLVRLSLKKGLNSGFLNYYLNQKSVQAAIKTLATRAVGQSNISASKLKTFNIPVPPDIREQEKIQNIIDALSQSVIKAREKKALQQALFSLVLHDLMTGKLRVNEALEYFNKEGSHV